MEILILPTMAGIRVQDLKQTHFSEVSSTSNRCLCTPYPTRHVMLEPEYKGSFYIVDTHFIVNLLHITLDTNYCWFFICC